MSWACVVGAAVGAIEASTGITREPLGRAKPESTDCEGCGAPLKLGAWSCEHCLRVRRGAERNPAYPLDLYEATARRINAAAPASTMWLPVPPMPASARSTRSTPAPAPRPRAYESTPPPAPAPTYDPPAPAPDFSSGGGGSFGGGGASGDW